jgi:hypothetical protein
LRRKVASRSQAVGATLARKPGSVVALGNLRRPDRGSQVRTRLTAGAKEIRTLRPTLNAGVPRGATLVPRTASSPESGPPENAIVLRGAPLRHPPWRAFGL